MTRVVHCWEDLHSWAEDEHGWGSDVWATLYTQPSATCLLAHGHDGDHEWTADSDIVIAVSDRK